MVQPELKPDLSDLSIYNALLPPLLKLPKSKYSKGLKCQLVHLIKYPNERKLVLCILVIVLRYR